MTTCFSMDDARWAGGAREGGDYRMLDSPRPPSDSAAHAEHPPMRVTLVVPHLLAIERAALAALPPLARLAAYAGRHVAEPEGLAVALFAAAGMARATPIAPLAALGAGFDPATHVVQFADPIALVAGRDNVLLNGRVDDITPDDAHVLIAMLNGHFAGDGLVFHAPRPDAWFLSSPTVPLAVTTPLPRVRGAIAPHLPHGEHGATWRRWMSEMQMLLHEHAVNAGREREGRTAVTGIWPWGGGIAPPAQSAITAAVYAPPGRPGDIARGIATRSPIAFGGAPARLETLAADADSIVVLPPVAGPQALAALADAWLAPAVTALERGVVAEVALLADDGGGAFTWLARAPGWTTRLRARFAPVAFVPPVADDD
jgi:hypothetical protein